ncbi:MAG TPA: aromatic ring-hydroxylating dioxygenase subunit alpha [Gemmatimonadaceae bacterium]|nr:aromatic ring-hydroxylating dioxygenase subunit alpha [Gemmatimonadaceae bacterium]
MTTTSRPARTFDALDGAASPERRDLMRWNVGTLHENWYVAALSTQVTGKKPFASTILDEPLVLFRGKDGRPTALRDRCLHRNAALSGGDVFDGCIGCPYHGWTYDASGACVTVPSEGPASTPRVARTLDRFPVVEQDGLVWVWMGDPNGATLKAPYRFPHAGEAGWSSYYMLTWFDGDVTDLVENFMDVPHTAFVHSGWFRKAGTAKRAEATVERTRDSVLVEYFQADDSIGFTRWLLNPDGKAMTHTDRFFVPNVTRVDYMWGERRGFVISSQITPVSPTRALVYTAIAFRFGVFNPIARLLLPWYTRVVIDQDVRIMANQTANIARFGGRRFHGTEADAIHRAIESLREHALEGGRGPAPEPFATRIAFWM